MKKKQTSEKQLLIIIVPVIIFFFLGLCFLGIFIITKGKEYFVGNIVPEIFGFFMEGFFFVGIFTLFKFFKDEKEQKRLKEQINIFLKSEEDNAKIRLPFSISRSDLNRMEVISRLGMLPTRNDINRYKIQYLSDQLFCDEVEKIKHSNIENCLIINCSRSEINQFDLAN